MTIENNPESASAESASPESASAIDDRSYQTERYGNITVFWHPELSGGGRTFGQQIVQFVSDHLGPADHAFEWCAGPGFIGFSLLAAGLCHRLTLADINPAAVTAVRRTIEYNDLGDRVQVYLSDSLNDVPPEESWDLVVGNPPHINQYDDIPDFGKPEVIYLDRDWDLHRRFYDDVSRRLRPGANVVVQEDSQYSVPDEFREMVRLAGLTWLDAVTGADGFYCVWASMPEV